MSDSHTSHEKWLSLLKDHLEKERYSPKTTLHCMGEATKFLKFIAKQKLTIAAAKPETVEHYLRLVRIPGQENNDSEVKEIIVPS